MTDKAVSYVRFSPRPDGKIIENNETIRTQRDRIERYAAFRGLELVREFSDPLVSARKNTLEDRDGGRRMLAYVKRYGIKHIVVHKWDRVFRRGIDGIAWVEKWRRRRISLHLADEGGNTLDASTAIGWLLLWMKSGLAQFEPMQTAERTQLAMRRYQSNGKRVSSILPYGWQHDLTSVPNGASGLSSRMVECPEEQAVIAKMLAWRAQGFGRRQIAKMLTEAGITCRGALVWHETTVRRILKRLKVTSESESPGRSPAAP
jgi:DNA invertase Pin-like site-specific DNA recombinase